MLSTLITVQEKLHAFRSNQSGATAIEYGLIAAGIAVVIIVAVQTLGDTLTGVFGDVADAM